MSIARSSRSTRWRVNGTPDSWQWMLRVGVDRKRCCLVIYFLLGAEAFKAESRWPDDSNRFRARGAWHPVVQLGQVCPTNALNLRELRGRHTNKRCRGDSWSNSRWLDIVRGKELSRPVNTESACRSSGESAVGQQRLWGPRVREGRGHDNAGVGESCNGIRDGCKAVR